MLKKILFSVIFLTIFSIVCFFYFFPGNAYFIAGTLCQKIDPMTAKNYIEKGILIYESQDLKSPHLDLAYILLAEIYFNSQDFDQSKLLFEKALSQQSLNARLHTHCLAGLLLIHLDEKNFEAAKIVMKKLNDHAPHHERVVNLNFIFHFKLISQYLTSIDIKSYYKALEDAAYYIEQIPSSSKFNRYKIDLYRDYALALAEQEKYDQAEVYNQKVLSLADPEDEAKQAILYNSLSYLHFKQNHPKESLDYAKKILEKIHSIHLLNEKAALLDTVACAFQINKDYTQAEKYMRETIHIAESLSNYDLNLKESYYKRLDAILEAKK